VAAGGSVPPVTSTTQVTVDPPASPLPPVATAAVLAATGVANVVAGVVSAIGLLVVGFVLLLLRRRRGNA
jgi:LPXTG-motif cell wall-anchored protein